MDHRYLRYFIAIAEELNFTRAAEKLHTVQPSLSQQIRKLEAIVGTPLLQRDRRHVELTKAGRVFLQEARKILQHTDNAIALARQEALAGPEHLTIGFLHGAEGKVFPYVLPILRARCPDIQLSLRSLYTHEQLAALESNQINVGFLRGPIQNPEIGWEVVLRNAIIAIVPAQHELAKLERIPVQRLAELPLVRVPKALSAAMHDLRNQIELKAGVQFHSVLDAENVLSTLSAVGSGLGFSLEPDYVQQILPLTVVARPIDLDPPPEIELLVAYRKDDKLPALAVFLSLLRECMVGHTEPV